MPFWNAYLLIGCEPQRDLRFEISPKLNSAILRSQSGFDAIGPPLRVDIAMGITITSTASIVA
jgi:hypothetical protein